MRHWAALGLCFLGGQALACHVSEDALPMTGQVGTVHITLEQVTLSRPFGLSLIFCDTPVETARVDAFMPAHQHGMNYQPQVTATGPGHFEAEGLVFHMPGLWEIRVEAETPEGTQTYSLEYNLK